MPTTRKPPYLMDPILDDARAPTAGFSLGAMADARDTPSSLNTYAEAVTTAATYNNVMGDYDLSRAAQVGDGMPLQDTGAYTTSNPSWSEHFFGAQQSIVNHPQSFFNFASDATMDSLSFFSPTPILATSESPVNILENGASAWQYPDARFNSPSVGSTFVPNNSHAFLAPADGQSESHSGMMHGAATSNARGHIGDSPAQIQAALDRRAEEATRICLWCGKRFVRASTLKEHQQRHDNLRQFTCAEGECNSVAFNTKGDLRSHTRRVHNNARKAK